MNAAEISQPRFSLRRFVQKRLRFIAVGMPLACAVLLLPYDGWLFELLRQFRLWNAVIGLVAGALLLVLRDWKFAGIALLAGLWQGWPVAEYRLAARTPAGAADRANSFTLLTCNLNLECRDPERMIQVLREARPDVMLLLEFTPEWQREFTAALWSEYPYRREDPLDGYAGICLASRLPLVEARIIEDARGVPMVRAVIEAAGMHISFLGVHPPPPLRPEMHDGWREAFGEWPALLGDARHRVLAGDFNCTPFARTFAALCHCSGLTDSARGFGITNTWHIGGTPLGLPIDHVLTSSSVEIMERTTGPRTGSDHRYVTVRLRAMP